MNYWWLQMTDRSNAASIATNSTCWYSGRVYTMYCTALNVSNHQRPAGSVSCGSSNTSSGNIAEWRAAERCGQYWRSVATALSMAAGKPVRSARLVVGTVTGKINGYYTWWRRIAGRIMSTTDGIVADQSTAAANASSEAVASSSDITRSTSPRLTAFPVRDGECDEAAVFADRQEREANSWRARTAAALPSSGTRRNSERTCMFKRLTTVDSKPVFVIICRNNCK